MGPIPRRLLGGVVTFAVIFNVGYVFHEILAAPLFKAGLGPGVQRAEYIVPVIALAFAVYVAMMTAAYPVVHAYFVTGRRWSKPAAGALLGLFFGVLWDSLQGGVIEYATYNVALGTMLADSAYHAVEGTVAGVLTAVFYRPRQ